ncbi:PREDICTED: cyclic AMP-dependent transcription factor ATF-1-like [Amphimedon queenslandica]|uniref:BZIP domain-containing protein n=1 Tax=Amphimedon queenslandica TaxID=400682 RepID=A0A1X7VWF6_AMPQE|nr:PREDICTED: cyclic AMP-dependent transcription factor ATF-1-like [Amphimedon queenslandica]|eukprot:XP_003382636.1 PREDICTED: cyclic AMP-dependent transcription factor ATF-1-like [Amphimedon queenslandica]
MSSDSSPGNVASEKGIAPSISVTLPPPEKQSANTQSDDDEEPPPISSEQLLRRASFKKILEDLSSSAESINKPGLDPAAGVSMLQQAAGLAAATNPALLPILQNLQQSALTIANQPSAATAAGAGAAGGNNDFTQQLAAAMMLPNHINAQQQLTAALLNSQANAVAQAPLIANAVSLAGHNNFQLPSNLLSSALLNASSNQLSNFGAQLPAGGGSGTPIGHKQSLRTVSSPEGFVGSPPLPGEDSTKKREIRLMKNREAARECRRKKKEYIRCLENRVAVLESQNQALIGELRALKELYLPKNQE